MAKQPTEYDYQEAEATGLGYMRHCLIQSSAIDDVRVTDSMLKVLVALGSYASRKNSNWCWAKEGTIALRLGVTRRLVRQATSALKACGYIEIREAFRDDGRQISNSYRILLDFELSDEHRRIEGQRSRAGIGGRKKGSPRNSEFQGGVNSEFQGGVNSEFQGGVNSEFQPTNPDSEGGSLRRKKKIARSHSAEKKTETPHLAPSVKPITQIAHRNVEETPLPPVAPPPSPEIGTWILMREELDKHLTPVQRRQWFGPLKLYRLGGDDWMLDAPTKFNAELVQTQWGGLLKTALHKYAGPDAELLITCLQKGASA